MRQVDYLLIHAAQVVTCASGGDAKRGAAMADCGIIPDGAIAIDEGRIVWVGTTAECLADFSGDVVRDMTGKAIVPGFVDCHTHVVFAGDRVAEFEMKLAGKTYLEILGSGGGILSTMRATRSASENDLYRQSKLLLDEMLRFGTTTAEIKTGYGLDLDSEMKSLRVIGRLHHDHVMDIVPTFLGAHAVPPEFKGRADAYVDQVIVEMLPAARAWYDQTFPAGDVPFFVDVFCEQNAFSLEQSLRILDAGDSNGMIAKAHVDEFNDLGAVKALAGRAVSLDHLDVTPDDTLQLLAQSETIGVMLPAVNFHLVSDHYAHARALIDSDGILALATDVNPGSAPCAGLPFVMALACRQQRLLPAEALNAITINAAYAIGMGDRVGSIEVGKQADLVVLKVDDYRHLAYQFGGSVIEQVIKGGEVVA